MEEINRGHSKRPPSNPGGKVFPCKEPPGAGCAQLLPGKGWGWRCTWGGDRIIHGLCNGGQVLGVTVFALPALGVLVWVDTQGIDGVLHGTEAPVESQVLTLAQVRRDQGISWIWIAERNRQNFRFAPFRPGAEAQRYQATSPLSVPTLLLFGQGDGCLFPVLFPTQQQHLVPVSFSPPTSPLHVCSTRVSWLFNKFSPYIS